MKLPLLCLSISLLWSSVSSSTQNFERRRQIKKPYSAFHKVSLSRDKRVKDEIPAVTNNSTAVRKHRYIESNPLYPFGNGLSYSEFHYDNMSIQYTGAESDLKVWLNVTNMGKIDSDEVIQCYLEWGNKSLPVPRLKLVYFDRAHFNAGQQLDFFFFISWENWRVWVDDKWAIVPGLMTLFCGGQQPGQNPPAPSNVLARNFTITSPLI